MLQKFFMQQENICFATPKGWIIIHIFFHFNKHFLSSMLQTKWLYKTPHSILSQIWLRKIFSCFKVFTIFFLNICFQVYFKNWILTVTNSFLFSFFFFCCFNLGLVQDLSKYGFYGKTLFQFLYWLLNFLKTNFKRLSNYCSS